ncbi:MAG: tRNA (adenosine(37)-N6)-threonylcarbamoyltransferase complex ATPase subunit type 1 TsaE, partial [Proteobacteria bacterium]|nr:tRNA (adenosine(37)-N6)-threonylcarbamoyltransferase complex ATPase subunit type 1 TsaE [Pseudomonadota bacterium]
MKGIKKKNMNENEIIAKLLAIKTDRLKGLNIGLVGELGSGKTHFVEKFLTNLSKEFKNQVSSPTFNLCNIYETGTIEVNHFDLYRIEKEEDLYQIGLWESI